MSSADDKMLGNIEKQSARRKRYESRRSFWMQTAYTGTLGVIMIVPIIAGAYIGRWLDTKLTGYSFSWTINLIVLGVMIGSINAYRFVKDRS